MSLQCAIIGGSGFIGGYTIRELLSHGAKIVVGDIRNSSHTPFKKADLRDESSLRNVVAGADVVIHLAWSTVPITSMNDPACDVRDNVAGSINLFTACVSEKVRRVIFCSSGGAVYGEPIFTPITETHPVNPLSSYGITKLAVEKYLHLFSYLYGLEYFILRPGNAYGAGQPSRVDQGVINACLAAIKNDQPFPLWGDGNIQRDYVNVRDIARAIRAAVFCPQKNTILNIGTGIGTSLNEVVEIAVQVTGKDIRIEHMPPRPIDVPVNILDASLAQRTLGWQAEITLQHGIQEQWMASQSNKGIG